MTAPQPGPREIVAGLADALIPALAADATPQARNAARDVARVLELDGLAAALEQLERLSGPSRPLEAGHLAARIDRILELAVREGDLAAFQASDRELAGLAAQLSDIEWSGIEAAAAPAVSTWELGEAFTDMRLIAAPEVARARLVMSVASALRAATDWLGADENTRVVAALNDSAVTVTLAVNDEEGIGPAGAVLAAVEGSMGREADGRWTLRVPRSTERPSFLLVRQGRFGFALPWHAVARLRMFGPHELDRLPDARLDALAALAPATTERPAAMMALGLARAWFIADRIVWRIAAHPEESDVAGPFAGATRIVEVESGERYWVLEPAWLLRGVPVAIPAAAPRLHSTPAVPVPAPPPRVAAALPVLPPPVPPAPNPTFALALAAERALEQLRGERAAAMRADAARAEAQHVQAAPEAATPTDELAAQLDRALQFGRAPQAPTQGLSEDIAARVDDAFSFDAPPAPPAATSSPMGAAAADNILFGSTPAATPAELAATDAVLFGAPQPPAASAAPPDASAAANAVLFGEPVPFDTARPADIAAVAAQRPAVRRALVADDSLVARIFLGRLLEQRGWIVESVSDAASLWDELRHGEWSLVCADFALPDASGRSHVQRLVDHIGRSAAPPTLVVLTRDEEEERVAREAGAALSLRKPFDSDHLDTLLAL